jgi:phosphoribosylaminoimidazolecarboxamide formyltransferase/IMP cyclohydrolase
MSEPIRRALISCSDKSGLADLGRLLASRNIEVLSTGGTASVLRAAGVAVVEIASHTGFPEILDGRVKTLHPLVHGGLLGVRDDPEHVRVMRAHGIAPIDLLIVNLYPFEATVTAGAGFAECVEQIDIGGPALIRAAAKNHASVTVITDPADYPRLEAEIAANDGVTSARFRLAMAAKAYARTAAYDAAIATWLRGRTEDGFPERLVLAGERRLVLRYGENPHQDAALYQSPGSRDGVVGAAQIQGKELSYNNFNDADAALQLAAEFTEPAAAIIKHANPCGVAIGGDAARAFAHAFACDPVSAFGGIVALNRPIDRAVAEALATIFFEVIVAPAIDDDARPILATKKALRVLITGAMPDPARAGLSYRFLEGGFLVQSRDALLMAGEPRVVTKRAPTPAEMADLGFAWRVCKHVKSNAIVFCRDGATVGIGAGQMSRLDAAEIAVRKARQAQETAGEAEARTKRAVVASDAFFPFADGLLACAEAGARAVIQPGGSVRDAEVIAAADEHDLAMVFTAVRHFRH